MVNYLDKVLYLYPDIQNVMYWQTEPSGAPLGDPYDGLEWNNTKVKKPTKEKLDSLDDGMIEKELEKRRQQSKDEKFAEANPVLHLEKSISDLQNQINSLNDSISLISLKTDEFIKKASLQNEEINGGMSAIKGFLMMIPDIQSSLSEMQSNLNKGK